MAIITRNDLISNGATSLFLLEFDLFFPNGFDWYDGSVILTIDHEPHHLIDSLARMFNYTGLYSCLDGFNRIIDINYIGGKRNDSAKGNPAYVVYCPPMFPGFIDVIGFYSNGELNNPGPNKPALIYYDLGKVYKRLFYKNGLKDDPAKGIPAVAEYDDSGNVAKELYYQDDYCYKVFRPVII